MRALMLISMMLASPPEPGVSGDWIAYLRRVGPVRIGMSVEQAREALGEKQGGASTPEGCSYMNSRALPAGVAVMLDGNRVVRIDISSTEIDTASGVGVGDTEQKIKSTYPGRMRITPHKYEKQGHYLQYVARDPQDQDVGIVFETDGTRVTTFRVGTAAAIALVERCG